MASKQEKVKALTKSEVYTKINFLPLVHRFPAIQMHGS